MDIAVTIKEKKKTNRQKTGLHTAETGDALSGKMQVHVYWR